MINESTLLGQVLVGLVTNVFGGTLPAALWLLIFLIAIGMLFRVMFGLIMLAISPIVLLLMANGWIPGAVGFPILLFIAVLAGISFFQTK